MKVEVEKKNSVVAFLRCCCLEIQLLDREGGPGGCQPMNEGTTMDTAFPKQKISHRILPSQKKKKIAFI